jgi:hypothetical protein
MGISLSDKLVEEEFVVEVKLSQKLDFTITEDDESQAKEIHPVTMKLGTKAKAYILEGPALPKVPFGHGLTVGRVRYHTHIVQFGVI